MEILQETYSIHPISLNMLFNIISLLLLLEATAFALPGQSFVSKRTLTPDNTCGNTANGANKGYTCDPNNAYGGPCCSSSGYCGG